jgi:replicative superfamily II helicase
MVESLNNKRWWQLPPESFPQHLLLDRRDVESTRLKSVLVSHVEQLDYDLWTRVRRAAALLERTMLDKEFKGDPIRTWEIVALIHESTGIVNKEERDYAWLLSALAWQLANATSIAALLASRLVSLDSFESRDRIERMALAFSYRKFDLLRRQSELAIAEGDILRSQAIQNGDWGLALEAAAMLSVGGIINELARYVEFQNDKLPDLAPIEDFLELAQIDGNSRRFRIGRLLSEVLRNFTKSNSRILVDQIPTLNDASRKRLHAYLRQYPELWPSQQDAITRGLLDPSKRHFVVAVPTSSGKTLCGELVIIQELTDNPDSVCFYVVPTRALVTEKTSELAGKLIGFDIRVADATGALQQDEIEADHLANAQVIICTPEKLDLLIRHEDKTLERATLFIIDETQMIADDDRGLGLEFVVIKLLLLKPKSRILLLSAMLSNSEEFGRWLSQEAIVSSSDWRPTRQRFGEIKFSKKNPSGSRLEINLYDTSGEFEGVNIPVAEYSRKPKSIAEQVVWAVEAFRGRGRVLIFCMSKTRCEKIAEEITNHLKNRINFYSPSPDVEKLRNKIKREVAEGFLLSEALSLGVAYHHADLPVRIRLDLEELISDNQIDVVVSTTTLAEGVNLPFSTVIFEDWMTKGDARPKFKRDPKPLDLSKFRNIAGRAGRAGKETEGLILFLDPDHKPVKFPSGEVFTPREYFIRSNYPSIKSRFLDIISRYKLPEDSQLDTVWETGDQRWNQEVRRALRQFSLAVLHALEVLKLDDSTVAEHVINHSLLAVQAPERKERAKEWFNTWIRFYRRINLEKEELRPIAMQVGLPLRSVQRLYSRAISQNDFLDLFRPEYNQLWNLRVTIEQIDAVTEMVASIQELDWHPENAPHNKLLGAWLNGAPIQALVDLYSPHLDEQKRVVERTCNYVTQQLSNAGAWGMYALTRILQLIIGDDNIAQIAKRLALLVYYGVNTTPAALLSMMGVERIDALRLGEAFLADGNTEVNLLLLKTWVGSMGVSRIAEILRGPDDRDIDSDTFRVLGIR